MRDTTAHPLVSDDLLKELATPDAEQQRANFTNDHATLLAIAAPEMARELLMRRAHSAAIPHPSLFAQSCEAARLILRAPDPISPSLLRNACRALLQFSTYAHERAAASDVLAQMQEAA